MINSCQAPGGTYAVSTSTLGRTTTDSHCSTGDLFLPSSIVGFSQIPSMYTVEQCLRNCSVDGLVHNRNADLKRCSASFGMSLRIRLHASQTSWYHTPPKLKGSQSSQVDPLLDACILCHGSELRPPPKD